MRTRKMRLVSALLAVAMLFVMMPVSAFATDAGTTSANYTYTLNSKSEATITKYTGNDGIIEIPKLLNGHKVVAIGAQAFMNCTSLTKVSIPDSITTIDYMAFCGCTNLEEIYFDGASEIKELPFEVFYNCQKLATINIPASVETIALQSFMSTGFTNIVLPEGVKIISHQAFAKCTSLKSITIPSTIVESWTRKVNQVDTSVKGVDSGAFWDCDALTDVYYNGTKSQWDKIVSYAPDDKTTNNPNDVRDNRALQKDGVVKFKYCDVTFNYSNGMKTETKQVETGTKVEKPAVVVANGYRLAGWYTNEACTNAFDFSTPVETDTLLYAKWEAIPDHQLTVTGGTFTVKDENVETKTEGDTLIANVPEGAEVTVTFNKAAYADSNLTFDGWKIEGLADAEKYTGETFTFTMPKNGVTIEAQTKAAAPAEDDSWDAATVVTGVVLGTGTAILAYHIGTELYAEQVLGKDVAVPKTREDVALKAWELAGKPAVELNGEPLSEAAQAEKWVVERGLMQNDAEGNFNGAKKMNKLKALRVLDAAKKLA